MAYAILHRSCGLYAALAVAVWLAGPESAEARVAPAAKCAAARYRVVGKALRGALACEVPAIAGKRGVDPGCLARVQAALARAWSKTDAAGACAPATLPPVERDVLRVRASLLARLHPVATTSRCAAGKLDRAGRYAMARLVCSARASLKSLPPGSPTLLRCVAAAGGRLTTAFRRLESRSDCQTAGDVAAVDTTLEELVGCVDAALSGAGDGACGVTTTTTTTTTTVSTAAPSTTLPVTTSTTSGASTSTTTSTTVATSTTVTTSTTSTTTVSSTTTTVTTTTTSTSSTLLPCGGLYPVCLGSCPEGQQCTGGALAEPCACAPITTTTTTPTSTSTTSSTLLACGGLFPVCLGSCPEGQTCSGENLAEPCSCIPLTTTTTVPPTTTTTTAAPTTTTTSTITTSTTSSTLLACGGLFPVCLGSCPAGQQCTGDDLLETCGCKPITTTTTSPTTTSTTSTTLLPCGGVAPVCLGSCPSGLSCTGQLLGACSCQ